MDETSDESKLRRAKEWVRNELESIGVLEQAPREAWLEALSDAYLKARSNGQGIDPGLVRLAVQALLDQTPSKGKPWNLESVSNSEGQDSEPTGSTRHIGIWTFRKQGRPASAERKAADIVHLVASVIGRFALPLVGETGRRNLHAKSACRVVAEVLDERCEQPRSPRRVLEVVERRRHEPFLQTVYEYGIKHGSQLRECESEMPSRRPKRPNKKEPSKKKVTIDPRDWGLTLPSAADLEKLPDEEIEELLEIARINEQRGIAGNLNAALKLLSDRAKR